MIRGGREAVIDHCHWSKCSHRHRARMGRYLLSCKSPCWKHRSHEEHEYYATARCHRSFAVGYNHCPDNIREQKNKTQWLGEQNIFTNNQIYPLYRKIGHYVPFTRRVGTWQVHLRRERLLRKAIWLRWPILAPISERWDREWVEGAPRSRLMHHQNKGQVAKQPKAEKTATHRLAALRSRSSWVASSFSS